MNAAYLAKALSVLMIAAGVAHAAPTLDTSARKGRNSSLPVPATPTTLTVQVIDELAKSLEGMLVEIDSQRGLVAHMEGYTDSKGRVAFKGLPADTYRIIVHTDFGPTWRMVTLNGPEMTVTMEW